VNANFIKLLPVGLLSTCILGAGQQPPPCVKLPAQITETIRSHMTADRAVEYCQSRKVASGDLNADKRQDIIIVYSLEGACGKGTDKQILADGNCGNGSRQYLAAFLQTDSGFSEIGPVEVGSIRTRGIAAIAVEGSVIRADTRSWDVTDANCCPSKRGRTFFVLAEGTLREQER
jgi:hypothetical protein